MERPALRMESQIVASLMQSRSITRERSATLSLGVGRAGRLLSGCKGSYMETRFSLTEFGHEYNTVDSVDVSGATRKKLQDGVVSKPCDACNHEPD